MPSSWPTSNAKTGIMEALTWPKLCSGTATFPPVENMLWACFVLWLQHSSCQSDVSTTLVDKLWKRLNKTAVTRYATVRAPSRKQSNLSKVPTLETDSRLAVEGSLQLFAQAIISKPEIAVKDVEAFRDHALGLLESVLAVVQVFVVVQVP